MGYADKHDPHLLSIRRARHLTLKATVHGALDPSQPEPPCAASLNDSSLTLFANVSTEPLISKPPPALIPSHLLHDIA